MKNWGQSENYWWETSGMDQSLVTWRPLAAMHTLEVSCESLIGGGAKRSWKGEVGAGKIGIPFCKLCPNGEQRNRQRKLPTKVGALVSFVISDFCFKKGRKSHLCMMMEMIQENTPPKKGYDFYRKRATSGMLSLSRKGERSSRHVKSLSLQGASHPCSK